MTDDMRQRAQRMRAAMTRLTGAPWAGALTYRDYGTGEPVTIPADLAVSAAAGKPDAWSFAYSYPDEPHANSVTTIALSADGGQLGDGDVVACDADGDGVRLVVARRETGDDRPALIRSTYLIQPGQFTLTKDVQFEGDAAFIERNQYRWSR